MLRHLKITHIIVLAAVVAGCGESQDPPGDEPAYVEAVCGNPSAKILCRASVEGIEAHIEEFGPIQEEMEEVYLTDFDPNDTELLKVITKVDRLNVQLADNTDMTFISNLQEARRVRINKNSNLVSLRGLEKLTHVEQGIELEFNPSLTSLDGLNGLQTLGGDTNEPSLFVLQNDKLRTLDGLSSLKSATNITIQSNASLETPGSFPALESVGGLLFWNNPLLKEAGDFPSLETVSKSLAYRENDTFPECEAEKLAEGIPNFDGDLTLEDNKPNSRCEDIE